MLLSTFDAVVLSAAVVVVAVVAVAVVVLVASVVMEAMVVDCGVRWVSWVWLVRYHSVFTTQYFWGVAVAWRWVDG